MSHHDDFAFDPVKGLPEHLPQGEVMLWQGSPHWQSLALRAFHIRKVAIYFAILAAAQSVFRFADGAGAGDALKPFIWYSILALLSIAILTGLAWLSARTTIYTITSKRVVMRIGMALPLTLNLPYSKIESADLRLYRDGTGDLPLMLSKEDRIAWAVLWPHARPFRFSHPEPMLRAVPNAEQVGACLASALQGLPQSPMKSPKSAVRFAPHIVTA